MTDPIESNCANCGAEVHGTRFCENCGAAQVSAAVSPVTATPEPLASGHSASRIRQLVFSRTGVIAAAVVVILVLAAVVVVARIHPTAKLTASASTSVSSGSETTLASSGVTIHLPANAISGSGTLSVSPTKSASGLAGVSIRLSGAKLVGSATLTFPHRGLKGEPVPLVGYAESRSGAITPAPGVRMTSSGASVTTSHFSDWFVSSWDSVLKASRGELQADFTSQPPTPAPTCAGEAAAAKAGVIVTGSAGSAGTWCLGETSAGAPQLTVTNQRGYIAAIEQSPGLTLLAPEVSDGTLIGSQFPFLTPSDPAKGTVTRLIAGHASYTYAISGFGQPQVRFTQANSTSLATSVDIAVHAFQQVAPFLSSGAPRDSAAVIRALGSVNCLSDLGRTADATATSNAGAEANLAAALDAALKCDSDAAAKYASSGSPVDGFDWVASQLHTTVRTLAADSHSPLVAAGYSIAVKAPVGLGFVAENAASYSSPKTLYDDLDLKSPSGNIFCGVDLPGQGGDLYLGCILNHHTYKDPPDSEHCAGTPGAGGDGGIYGGGFTFNAAGKISVMCTQAEQFGQFAPAQTRTLPYGHSVTFHGFIFLSQPTGLSVVDLATRHGFRVNLNSYSLF